MGSSSTTQIITADHAEQLRAAPAPRLAWGERDSFASRLRNAAVGLFHDSEEGRHAGDVYAYDAHMLSVVPDLPSVMPVDYDSVNVNDAYIIPVAAAESVTTATQTVDLTVPGVLANRLHARPELASTSVLRKILQDMFPLAVIGDYEVVRTPTPRKVKAGATAGAAVTRYRIVVGKGAFSVPAPVFEAQKVLHVTRAEARSAAVDLMNDYPQLESLGVEAVVGRLLDDGTLERTLVTVTRPIAERVEITVSVTTHTVKPNAKIDRYEVMFWHRD